MAPEVRRELQTLGRGAADSVANHLLAAGSLLDEDPHRALLHARAARARAARITAVREAVGIAAYRCGDWSQALTELRAARRMGSASGLLPLIADCERGLGRPQRAIELADDPEADRLSRDEADELRIVVAAARADLKQLEQALTVISGAQLEPGRSGPTPARLSYARAEILLALGRDEEALQWFLRAASVDIDGVTDAEERIEELSQPKTLAERHDCLLIDLDGTVFKGSQPTIGAVEVLARVSGRTLFVTNNASRSADEVAAHLKELGFGTTADEVVTSAQAGARLLAADLAPGSKVLIVGTDALAAEVSAVGLTPVRSDDERPIAVLQGHSPDTGWADLAEAVLAIRRGATWVATNTDRTLPSERGLLPGNGAMVEAVRAATGAAPRVAGKPEPTLLVDALEWGHFSAPLVIGDRLDTDIAAANAADLPSLLVLTGVSTVRDVVFAVADQRPTYLASDLRSLTDAATDLAISAQPGWRVSCSRTAITVNRESSAAAGNELAVVRAVAHAVWEHDERQPPPIIKAADDASREALWRWALLSKDTDPDLQ